MNDFDFYPTLLRRVWYGGRKGRSARRRLERAGYVVYPHDGAPLGTLCCALCGGPRRRLGFEHSVLCPGFTTHEL